MGIKEEKIKSIMRERVGAKARGVVTYVCKTKCGKTAKDVGRYFGRGESVLSEMMKNIELELAEKGSGLYKLVQQIITDIKKNNRPCFVREIK